jgi:hypothetical protein
MSVVACGFIWLLNLANSRQGMVGSCYTGTIRPTPCERPLRHFSKKQPLQLGPSPPRSEKGSLLTLP